MTERIKFKGDNNFLKFWAVVNQLLKEKDLPEMLYDDARYYFELSGIDR